MNGIWVSLKESMNCSSKITDIVATDKTPRLKSSTIDNGAPTDKPAKFWHFYLENRFHELGIGNPSRNIVEMIYRASSSNPTRSSRKMKRALKVNHSSENLARFEKYREAVMLSSHGNRKRHTRSIVDGNEVLQFYGTTMSCCGTKGKISQLCRNPGCRVCRVIQSGFDTCYNRKYGIRLNTNSEHASEDNKAGFPKGKKAVIICRTIAGEYCRNEDEFDGDGLCAKPQSIVLRNSAAVLPCFVLVFG